MDWGLSEGLDQGGIVVSSLGKLVIVRRSPEAVGRGSGFGTGQPIGWGRSMKGGR